MNMHHRILLLLAIALSAGVARAEPAPTNKSAICQLCGMDASVSETEFVLNRSPEPALHACCINCAKRLLKKTKTESSALTARDFSSGKQVPAEKAFFVFGSKRIPKGSMAPFVFAFETREQADAFQKAHEGSVLTFQEALAKLNEGCSCCHQKKEIKPAP